MDLTSIKDLMSDEIKINDAFLISKLTSQVELINEISHYIIENGGKRLRPLIVMLVAKALSFQNKNITSCASIIELIHTATLLHDDVVDDSALRRGKATANTNFGNPASVLTGDFLYSRAFQLMVEINDMRVMKIFANATNIIAEGEVLQLINCNDTTMDEQRYFKTIYCKTSKLFEAACEVACILNDTNDEITKNFIEYGIHLGNAFQLTDDVIDYLSDAETMGKNVGDDIREGKATLPVIFALKNLTGDKRAIVKTAIENGSDENLTEILDIINQSGGIQYTLDKAINEASIAKSHLESLNQSPYKDALLSLADLSVHRLK